MNINVITVFRKDKIKQDRTAPIHIRFTLNRKSRYVSTGITLGIDDWDFDNQRIKDLAGKHGQIDPVRTVQTDPFKTD